MPTSGRAGVSACLKPRRAPSGTRLDRRVTLRIPRQAANAAAIGDVLLPLSVIRLQQLLRLLRNVEELAETEVLPVKDLLQ